jgi:hypothetical protein
MDGVGVKNESDELTVGIQAADPTEPFGKGFCSLHPDSECIVRWYATSPKYEYSTNGVFPAAIMHNGNFVRAAVIAAITVNESFSLRFTSK